MTSSFRNNAKKACEAAESCETQRSCGAVSTKPQHSFTHAQYTESLLVMAEASSLEGLQSLHRDIVALCENRLPHLERLWIQLQDRIEEFRKLLDKPPRNEASRQSLATGS